MSTSLTTARLKLGDSFSEVFSDLEVPIVSLFPTRLNESAPLCYIVDARHLSEDQINQLGQMLFDSVVPLSLSEAVDYVRSGLPLSQDHFEYASTSDPAQIAFLM